MPTIRRVDGYTIELHTGRERSFPHVHVKHKGRDVVFNLLRHRPYGKVPFRLPKKVRNYLAEHQQELLEEWDRYHG